MPRLVILFTSRMLRMFDENKYLFNEQNDEDDEDDEEDNDEYDNGRLNDSDCTYRRFDDDNESICIIKGLTYFYR